MPRIEIIKQLVKIMILKMKAMEIIQLYFIINLYLNYFEKKYN
jgi:hypothetical protein